jgi:hypothetical protein
LDGNEEGQRPNSASVNFDTEMVGNWKTKTADTVRGLTRSRKGLTRSRRHKKKKKRLDEEVGRGKSSGRIAPN